MLEELLKIISDADNLILQHAKDAQEECNQLMTSCVQELNEIDEKIHQHLQDNIEW